MRKSIRMALCCAGITGELTATPAAGSRAWDW